MGEKEFRPKKADSVSVPFLHLPEPICHEIMLIQSIFGNFGLVLFSVAITLVQALFVLCVDHKSRLLIRLPRSVLAPLQFLLPKRVIMVYLLEKLYPEGNARALIHGLQGPPLPTPWLGLQFH